VSGQAVEAKRARDEFCSDGTARSWEWKCLCEIPSKVTFSRTADAEIDRQGSNERGKVKQIRLSCKSQGVDQIDVRH